MFKFGLFYVTINDSSYWNDIILKPFAKMASAFSAVSGTTNFSGVCMYHNCL